MDLMLDRRSVLGGIGVLGAAPAFAQVAGGVPFIDYPFQLGVAAGDPDAGGFVIWTRLAPRPLEPDSGLARKPISVRYEVSEAASFASLAAEGSAIARPELGHSVHATLSGLQPGRPYFYRFIAGGERSPIGRAKTLPAAGAAVDKVRLGVAGCQDYQAGLYTAWRHMAREDADAIFFYGDYIYEYGARASTFSFETGEAIASTRLHNGPETFSLDDYRQRYSQTRTDLDLQTAHASCAWLCSIDDHEIVNNWVSDHPPGDVPPEVFRLRRAAAMQAWYEFMPVRADALPRDGISGPWRQYRFGTLLDARMLNTRNHRSNQPCGDKFGSWCADVKDPKAEVLGQAQENWLVQGLSARPAIWNALLQQVMMMNLDRARADTPTINPDSWAGYAAPRDRLLKRLERTPNLVILTGDEHQHFAGEVRATGSAPESKASAIEFVTTSVSSGSDGVGVRRDHAKILDRNPGLKYVRDERGYAMMTITPDSWTADLKVVDTVRTPGGKLSTSASFRIPSGTPRLEKI